MNKRKQKINKQAKNQKAPCDDPFSGFPLPVFSVNCCKVFLKETTLIN